MRNLIASLNNFSFKCYFLFFTIIIDYSGYLFDFGCHSFFLYSFVYFFIILKLFLKFKKKLKKIKKKLFFFFFHIYENWPNSRDFLKSWKFSDISRNLPKEKEKSCRNLEKKLPDFFLGFK